MCASLPRSTSSSQRSDVRTRDGVHTRAPRPNNATVPRWVITKPRRSSTPATSHFLALPIRPGHEGHVHHDSGRFDRDVAVLVSLFNFGGRLQLACLFRGNPSH